MMKRNARKESDVYISHVPSIGVPRRRFWKNSGLGKLKKPVNKAFGELVWEESLGEIRPGVQITGKNNRAWIVLEVEK